MSVPRIAIPTAHMAVLKFHYITSCILQWDTEALWFVEGDGARIHALEL